MKLLVGGDPEIFLKDMTSGTYVSATDFDVPGTKRKPHPVKGGAIQIDGTALEFNIEPASDSMAFASNIQTVLGEAKAFVPKNIEFVFSPVVEYEKGYFNALPAECLKLGCDPDYSAESGNKNNLPAPFGTMRTGAGHLTLGWGSSYDPLDAAHFWDCRQMSLRLLQYFDVFRPFWDTDKKRQRMYGAGACFRPKAFGVEFRSLSNAWVGKPALHSWIFDSVKFVFDHAVAGKEMSPNYHYCDAHDSYYGPKTVEKKLDMVNAHICDKFRVKDLPAFPMEALRG